MVFYATFNNISVISRLSVLSVKETDVPNTFEIFGFAIFRYLSYLMKIIPETRRAHLNLISTFLL